MSTEREPGVSRAHLAPAASRALRILDFLALTPQLPQQLTAIAQHLNAAKSSVLNLCAVLEDAQFIERRADGYVLGRRVVELGGAYLRRFDVTRSFYQLAEADESLHDGLVQLGMLFDGEVLYLARKEAARAALRLTAGVGEALPAVATAIGRAVLSTMPWTEVERLLGDSELPLFTERSVRTRAQLKDALQRARELGYSVDRGGVFPNVTGVAVPLPRIPGERPLAVGASIVDPEHTADVEALAGALADLARALSNPMIDLSDPLAGDAG